MIRGEKENKKKENKNETKRQKLTSQRCSSGHLKRTTERKSKKKKTNCHTRKVVWRGQEYGAKTWGNGSTGACWT